MIKCLFRELKLPKLSPDCLSFAGISIPTPNSLSIFASHKMPFQSQISISPMNIKKLKEEKDISMSFWKEQ